MKQSGQRAESSPASRQRTESLRDRRTDGRSQTRRIQTEADIAASFRAIAAGASLGQLDRDAALELSHRIGNSALAELVSRHGARAREAFSLPSWEPETESVLWDTPLSGDSGMADSAGMDSVPDSFSALSPMEGGVPWTL